MAGKSKKTYAKKSFKEIQEEISQLTEKALENVESYVDDPEEMIQLLDFMSNFHQYSYNNMQLIRSQFKGAYAVASFDKFKKLGFRVNKGEKGIKILFPSKVKMFRSEAGTLKKFSEATEEEIRKIKNKEIKPFEKVYFGLGSVFDISQTNAKPSDLPKLLPNRNFDYDLSEAEDIEVIKEGLDRIAEKIGIKIKSMDASSLGIRDLGAAKGAYVQAENGEEEILLNHRNTDSGKIAVAIHELAHAALHKGSNMTPPEKELQAEMVAYTVCKYLGIDTSESSIHYMAKWTDNGNNVEHNIHDLLEEVKKCSHSFITSFDDIERNREISFEKEFNNLSEKKVVTATSEIIEKNNVQEVDIEKSNRKFTHEEKEKARNVNILGYIQATGQEHLLSGKPPYLNYNFAGHGSIVIDTNKNLFFHNGNMVNTGSVKGYGNAVDFVMYFEQLPFYEAVKKLNSGNYEVMEHSDEYLKKIEEKKEPYKYKYKHSDTTENIENYLINMRHLDPDIIKKLIDDGMIYEDKYDGKAIFVWREKGLPGGKILGSNIRRTRLDDPFYGVKKKDKVMDYNTTKNEGFSITFGTPKRLIFFEAAIDLVSYLSMHPNLKDTRLIDNEGVLVSKVEHHFLESGRLFGTYANEIVIASDNDPAGQILYDNAMKRIDNNSIIFSDFNVRVTKAIPFDNQLKEEHFYLYKEIASTYSVNWEQLAAAHKLEVNLRENDRIANGYGVEKYFAKARPADGKNQDIELKTCLTEVAKNISTYTDGFQEGAVQKYNDYVSLYQSGRFEVVDTIGKDHNEQLSYLKENGENYNMEVEPSIESIQQELVSLAKYYNPVYIETNGHVVNIETLDDFHQKLYQEVRKGLEAKTDVRLSDEEYLKAFDKFLKKSDVSTLIENLSKMQPETKIVHEYQEKQLPTETYNTRFDYYLLESDQTNEVEKYLIEECKINSVIVKSLVQKGYLKQDMQERSIFKWINSNGRVVGANLVGTYGDRKVFGKDEREKDVVPESDTKTNFNIILGNPNKVFIFSNPINLLSFWTLYKDKLVDSRLQVSNMDLSSIKGVLENSCQRNQNIEMVHFCFDKNRDASAVLDEIAQSQYFDRESKKFGVVDDKEVSLKVNWPKSGGTWEQELSFKYERMEHINQYNKEFETRYVPNPEKTQTTSRSM